MRKINHIYYYKYKGSRVPKLKCVGVHVYRCTRLQVHRCTYTYTNVQAGACPGGGAWAPPPLEIEKQKKKKGHQNKY